MWEDFPDLFSYYHNNFRLFVWGCNWGAIWLPWELVFWGGKWCNDCMTFHLFLWWISRWYDKPNCIWKIICETSLEKMKTISSLLETLYRSHNRLFPVTSLPLLIKTEFMEPNLNMVLFLPHRSPQTNDVPALSTLGKLWTQFGMMGFSINCYK